MKYKSDTSSVASGNASSSKKNRRRKFVKPTQEVADEVQDCDMMDIEKYQESQRTKRVSDISRKKVVHFNGGAAAEHIELRDLKEKDFLDLIEAKNQDKRFYGWLHFGPIFEETVKEFHYHVDPLQDIEYFRQLYDNTLFTSLESTQVDHNAAETRSQ